jgi:ankyrin repeat protein
MDFVCQAFDAAKQGNLAFFNMFIQNPRMADMRDENDDTLMHAAATHNQPDVIKILHDNCGLNVNLYGCSSRTPLICASYEGHLQCIQVLLERRANISLTDSLEENALHKAATRGHAACLALLLSCGVHDRVLNEQNVTGAAPLHAAMDNGHQECCQLLLQVGANPSLEDFFGYKPTFRARTKRPYDLMRINVDVNTWTFFKGSGDFEQMKTQEVAPINLRRSV